MGNNPKSNIKGLTLARLILVLVAALAPILTFAPTAEATFTRYFRTTAPSEPMPNAYWTVDNPAGTLEQRVMTLAMGDAATASSHAEPAATVGYYKGVIFISDPLVAESVPAGNWTVHAHATKGHTLMVAYLKFYIYSWTSGDAFGTAIAGPTQHPTRLATTDAGYELTMSGNAVNFAAGDKLVVEVYFNVTNVKTGYTVDLYWGKTTPGTPAANDDDGWITGPGTNVPTLGWPLFLLTVSLFTFLMIKKGKLSPRLRPVTLLLLVLVISGELTLPCGNEFLMPFQQSAPAVSITGPDGKRYELKPTASDATNSIPNTSDLGGAEL